MPALACCAVWGLQQAVQLQREGRLPAGRKIHLGAHSCSSFLLQLWLTN